MPRPTIAEKPMSAAERQRRARENRAMERTEPPEPGSAAAILEAAFGEKRRRTGYTASSQWLWENRAAIAAKAAETGKNPPWRKLADLLNEVGITGQDGKPVTAGSLRYAWVKLPR